MLEVSGICHSYGKGPPVLQDVTFRFDRPNGLLALVGASGSGKSTLLGIIGNVLTPTSGTVSVGVGSLSREVSWLSQTPNVLGHRSTVHNVAVGVLSRTPAWSSALEQASDALDRYGLADRSAAKAKDLSGGEIQRMVLARAELARSGLLLADEPSGQLDSENTARVTRALRQVADSGAIVVVATHDPAVSQAADGVLSIVNGTGHYVESS